jgi:dienelactone hydrolase
MHRVMLFCVMRLVTAVCAILATSMTARAQAINAPNNMDKIAGLDVALWLPPTGPGTYPLVLFSHAFGGCKTQSSYLMRALAQNGILVAAPDHKDSRCGERLSLDLPPIFLNPESWSDGTYADRRDGLHEVRTGLLTHPTLATSIDPARVALVGHSLGGYTVLALAGARNSWKMKGISGAVALAPYTDPFLTGGTPESISVPVLLEVGEQDSVTHRVDGVYSKISSQKCRIIYKGAHHFAWVDPEALPANFVQSEFQGDTAAAAIAFLKDVFAGRPTTIPPTPLANGCN